MSNRLSLALTSGALTLPETGPILVLHPTTETDLSALPQDRVQIVQPFCPDHNALAARGYDCAASLPENTRYGAALICLPRAKALARALVAQAAQVTDGPVLVDGAKTDGIDSLFRDLRKRVEVSAPYAKAHGKIFGFPADPDALTGWLPGPHQADGYTTAPGVFSADGIDPASAQLVAHLPAKLGRVVADLGAGWGYLSAQLTTDPEIEALHLVEADATALACARLNVTDSRAEFHWADARDWSLPGTRFDTIVMNPPFHTSRAADPALGRAFIANAARLLVPSGSLWLVANRHLPYETLLTDLFAKVEEAAGDPRFKVLHATRPRRKRVRAGGQS
jgi:16S rRNA (guanine1207-N2)-methyltransferase